MMPLAYIYCEQYWMERPETRVKNGNDVCETFCHVKSGCEGPLACTVNNSGWRDVRVGWKKPWHEWNILCYSQLWCEGAFSMYFAMFSKQNTHTHTHTHTHTYTQKWCWIILQTCNNRHADLLHVTMRQSLCSVQPDVRGLLACCGGV